MFDKVLKKQPSSEEEEEGFIDFIKEPFREERPVVDLDETVFNFLKQEFEEAEFPDKLVKSTDASAPPLCVLRVEDEVLSLWHRLPIRGESGVTHIPDFVIFRGNHRMSPRERNPDVIIECRSLESETSNRTDPRVVNDVIGRSLDTLSAQTILITNRPVSDYASALADSYGINKIDAGREEASYELFKMISSRDQPTREKFRKILAKDIHKLENFYKVMKRERVSIEAEESLRKGGLRERIVKALSAKPGSSAADLSLALKVHDDYILNELYMLQKDGKVKIVKQSKDPMAHKHHEWSLRKSAR